mmetsp:Transcript_35185/g.58285  ORF Transcript_35185/g.58285 Transcript_35185/m.58285 type:complete len:226 (-) Transcript_35185:227-904(-)
MHHGRMFSSIPVRHACWVAAISGDHSGVGISAVEVGVVRHHRWRHAGICWWCCRCLWGSSLVVLEANYDRVSIRFHLVHPIEGVNRSLRSLLRRERDESAPLSSSRFVLQNCRLADFPIRRENSTQHFLRALRGKATNEQRGGVNIACGRRLRSSIVGRWRYHRSHGRRVTRHGRGLRFALVIFETHDNRLIVWCHPIDSVHRSDGSLSSLHRGECHKCAALASP